jgi:GxxExxY protein
MIYEQETALLRKGLFEIQNQIGLGRYEEHYHKAFCLWLQQEHIPFSSKQPHPLLLDEETAYILYPDIVVWDKITVELKAVPRFLTESEHVKIFNYLKKRNDRLGLLVNMGLDRVHAERIIYNKPSHKLHEDWKCWDGTIQNHERAIGLQIRDVLHKIYELHTTGYGTEILQKLIHFGLKQQKILFTSSPSAPSYFQEKLIGTTPLDCLIINNKILLIFSALYDSNEFNISRGLSFMASLRIPWGIAVNFGKKDVHINALLSSPSQFIRGSALPSAG